MKKRKKALPQPNARLALPDWNCDVTSFRPHSNDIPQPWIYKWPNDHNVKRDVDIQVNTWRGIAICASHYYAHIVEEPNAIWDGKEICWVTAREHPTMKQRDFKADVLTLVDVETFVKTVIGAFFFDGEKYRFLIDGEPISGIENIARAVRSDQ